MKVTFRTLVFFLFLCFCSSANAISIITDEETEIFLQNIVKPLYRAAGVMYDPNKVYIVNDNTLNAFVGEGNNLFIYTGILTNANSKNEVEGVIAHETGHILGGHILRIKLKIQELQRASLASFLVAGAAAAISGRGDIAMAVVLGSQSSLINSMTSYQVEEERSADQAAIKLLDKLGKNPVGIRDFMMQIQKANLAVGIEETPYFRTHPVTTERITFMEESVRKSPHPIDRRGEEEFRRVKAKLSAYLDDPRKTLRRYSGESIAAKYARSIAYFKMFQVEKAIKELDELIEMEPRNPFFYELKGQIYLETGKVKLARAEYKKALDLLPNSANFQINLAQTVLEDEPSKAELKYIVDILNKSIVSRPSSYNWLLLSRAYGMLNDMANSNYAAAEYSTAIGSYQVAEKQAEEAKKHNPNPRLSLKIDDLLVRLKDLNKDNNFPRRRR